ncbi:MAG TPA: radical SAM protein [Candidatus Omnitrophota bacterium]|nr:radical SAM protein [Candidatus Omnitrophota bacterium]
MNTKDLTTSSSLIKKSFTIASFALIPVLSIYFLDIAVLIPLYTIIGPFIILLVAPLKILAYSGMYGALTELACGEELTLTRKRFQSNAFAYWPYYFVIIVLPSMLYFIATASGFVKTNINAYFLFAHIQPFLLFLLATALIKTKYLRPSKLAKRKIRFTSSIMATLLGFFIAALLVFYLPYVLPSQEFWIARFLKGFSLYLNAWIYSYYALLILRGYPEILQQFRREKEIYLINPLSGGIFFHLTSIFLRSYPPIFVVIKALTPKSYKFREFNRLPWKKHYYAPNKLVAITCFSANCMDVYQIAREFRKRGSKVVMGGPHVTFFPDEALEYCDSVVCGEAESIWPQIIQDYEHNALQRKYLGSPVENCHDFVYQELLNSPPAVIKSFLETSRGCKFNCHFCAIPSLSQRKLRKQNISQFIELLRKVRTKYKHILLLDNNIYSDPAHTKELLRALKPLRLKWSTQCSIDIAKNTDMLELAKESGCEELLFGFEISEDSFEKQRGGKFALADHYREYARKVKEAGIAIKAHYIFGFESDSFSYLLKLWKFCFTVNPLWTVLSILTPLPGTQFYHEMMKQDRIANLNWSHYGCQTLVFHHPRIPRAVLTRTYPLIYLFFLLTTSKGGYALLFILIMLMIGVI